MFSVEDHPSKLSGYCAAPPDLTRLFFLVEALQSIVDLGFPHNLLPFPTVSGHFLPFIFISIIFKSSSTSFLHLLLGLPFLFVASNVAVAGFGIFWFCILLT